MGDLLARLQSVLGDAYHVERELGGGGMSRLFLATEASLHRLVVIKLLPPELASEVSATRFKQEFELAARLQHPNILPVLSAGAKGDLLFYVMPFVSGESLRHRLTREGKVPVPDAARILHDVADALAHAHSEGVIHRDIKPENILLEGSHPVLTDFGVARVLAEARSGGRLTDTGISVGTPAYMSPEQAAGERNIDARADVYALAVVGYEMLAGFPPFVGPTARSLIAAHLTETPKSLRDVRPETTPEVADAIMRALTKDPNARLQTAAEFRDAVATSATGALGQRKRRWTLAAATSGAVGSVPRWLKVAIGAAGLVVVVAGTIVLARRGPEALTLGKVTQITFEPGLEVEPSISPDGKLVAYAAGPLSAARVYVRQPGGRPVALAAGAGPSQRRPRWSPDGTRILFEAGANVFVTPAFGGVPRLMAGSACCAAWSPDGRRVAYVRSARREAFVAERPESVYVMPADDGPSRLVGSLVDPHSLSWSPDGRWLAMVSGNDQFAVGVAAFGNKGPSSVVLVPVEGGAPVPVTDNASLNVSPVWTPDSRHILFVSDREGARDVYAARVGTSGLSTGRAIRLTTGLNAHSISLSADGTRLAYAVYTSRANVWSIQIPSDGSVSVDRATQVTTGNQTVEQMAISRDGRWLYFDSDRSGNADIYRMRLGGGEPEQLTTDPADDFAPDVSPDGRWVAFHSLRLGTRDIFVMPAEGGEAQRVTDDPGEERVPIWSPDGRSLSFFLSGTGTRDGCYVISKDQAGRWGAPRRVWHHPTLSSWAPDGRTLAAVWSDGIWLIPAGGGTPRRVYQQPPDTIGITESADARWSPDARTIYVKALDGEGRAAFWGIPATGGRARLLVRFDDPGKPSPWLYGWVTEGGRFYFIINDLQSDIYVAELRGVR